MEYIVNGYYINVIEDDTHPNYTEVIVQPTNGNRIVEAHIHHPGCVVDTEYYEDFISVKIWGRAAFTHRWSDGTVIVLNRHNLHIIGENLDINIEL